MAEYASNFPPLIADMRLDQYRKTQANLFFAWSGGVEKSDPHYYRVQTPAFLIEYDDTQNNANHIHSVWRDFRRRLRRGSAGRSIIRRVTEVTSPRQKERLTIRNQQVARP